ncbi:MAG: addiction module protein [Kofleriaceae bacterium]
MTTQELLEAALDLAPGERQRLVEQRMDSLVAENEFAADEIEREWLGESQRRSAEVDAGTAELEDWTDVRARIAARRARR